MYSSYYDVMSIFFLKNKLKHWHIRGHSKSMFIVEGRGVIERQTKMNRGRGVLACVYVHFFNKNIEISKMKFYI